MVQLQTSQCPCAGVILAQHNETAILFRESALSATAASYTGRLEAKQRYGKSL